MNRLTFHGHAAFELVTSKGTRLMFDPWLDQNPRADIKTADVSNLDYILVSHGHGDHFSDVIKLARQTDATVLATFELVSLCQAQGVKHGHGMSVGGGYRFPFGYAKLTPALHGTGIDGGAHGIHSTMPNGWWVDLGDARIYHAGDTALLTDMQLLQGKVDVALLRLREIERSRRRLRELGDLADTDGVARPGLDQAREHLDGCDEAVVRLAVRLLERGAECGEFLRLLRR